MLKSSHPIPLYSLDPASCEEGASLPIFTYTISIAEVFMFSAITWNRHRIHYDKDQAIREGHDGVLVQRGLIGNILCRYIYDIFIEADISNLNWKVIKSTLADSTLTASGLIAGSAKTVNGVELNLTLRLSNDSNVLVCQASAVVHGLKNELSRPLSPFGPTKI
jgi:hydroxyacyl-ACP dehydratase HTD2-like protein with hotdog domain